MPHEYCPCGLLLSKSSTVQSSKSPSLQLFISIQTMKLVPSDIKLCNTCRTTYYNWQTSNPEFRDILYRIENEYLKNIDINGNTDSVNNNNGGVRKVH